MKANCYILFMLTVSIISCSQNTTSKDDVTDQHINETDVVLVGDTGEVLYSQKLLDTLAKMQGSDEIKVKIQFRLVYPNNVQGKVSSEVQTQVEKKCFDDGVIEVEKILSHKFDIEKPAYSELILISTFTKNELLTLKSSSKTIAWIIPEFLGIPIIKIIQSK